MKIKLEANPAGLPGCVKIVAEDGRDVLLQSDWDWPGTASTFGWDIRQVQAPGRGPVADSLQPICDHSGTDGTVKCEDCGLAPGDFITAARKWLDDHDGAVAEDPGYFENQ